MAKKIKFLVLHCLATPEGREVTVADLTRWHKSPVSEGGRGWKQFGYRDFIHLDGTVDNLIPNNDDDFVDPWEISNGVAGINAESNHIAYVGGVAKDGKTPKDTRTAAQYSTMANYVLDFVNRHPHILVAGHNQFAAKACPSFDTVEFCREIGLPEENIYLGK